MRLAAIFSIFIAIIYILFQALNGAYYYHLYPDVFTFYDRASFFWDNFVLTNLGHNEYQPGAIAFFAALSPVFLITQSVESFKWALFAANISFILLISFLMFKMEKPFGVLLISLFLVFLGPILLFRFDLLVILLVILSLYLWQKDKHELSMLVLAFAVITKVYPLIFLPYLIYQNYKTGKKFEWLYILSIFAEGFLLYLLAYTYIFQISFADTYASYNFHNLKSVATESVWASALYFHQFMTGQPLSPMESAYGINAIAREEIYPSIAFYNYFWVVPVGILYLVYFLKNKHWGKIDYQFLTLLLLVFLIFSKVFSNQYWAWFLLIVPLIDVKTLIKKTWIINIFLIILTTIMHTFIYPLNYSEWLAILSEGKMDLLLFWTAIISNLILLILAIRISYQVFKQRE